ncbi:MAG: FAD-binding and (Fe-S)-binding domain-containing protein [Propionibacteriaceae bacterium]
MTALAGDQLKDLRSHLGGAAACVDSTTVARALYSSDASIYRIVPLAVAKPRDVAELQSVLAAARAVELPVTGRGAGTSCAGNALGAGLVVDMGAHLTKVLSIDPDARAAVVEPGLVQESLQRAAKPYGLRFGPDPSTATRCTIGGMIGNNACGPRALGYGTSATNLLDAEVVTGMGEVLRLSTAGSTEIGRALLALGESQRDLIEREFGRFGRQVSGYSLEHLLTGDISRFFAGSEGTLGLATELTVRLVRDPAHRVTVALGYASMAEAADAMGVVLPFQPTAVEGLDRRIVDVVRKRRGDGAVPPLPRGDGWLFVELAGEDLAEVRARAEQLLAASGAIEGWLPEGLAAAALWTIRADGAGLAGVSLAKPAYAGWEDAAVPPLKLGAYLRAFDALLDSYHLHGLPYGHFGDGCVHCRIDFPLVDADGPARYRDFVTDAARLVASYGGSLSGEHGDGRARSELLREMYSAEAISLFGEVKSLFDPAGLMNPGVLVDPDPVDADIREWLRRDSPISIADPQFAADVHRCTGVGKCVAADASGVMCPTYQATHDEAASTRGRARVLQEMVNSSLVTGGWRAEEVHEVLDLCLACKGCSRDCPTGTDMAAYKSHVLDEAYRGRVRPRTHYSLGWLPRWTRLVGRVPGLGRLANALLGMPGIVHIARWAAGVDQRRPLPRFASRPNRVVAQEQVDASLLPTGKPVVVWVDSFTDGFETSTCAALIDVLRAAGYDPQFLDQNACCGLTWITTGQLDGARHQLRHALDVLHPIVAAGVPVLGIEPSCTAVWRSDALELLPDDPRVAEMATGVRTLAELLVTDPQWEPPDLSGTTIVAQPHCHHASVLGWAADSQVLNRTGAEVVTLGGCCGLAGNFGVEQGHYDMSLAVAENELLPALRESGPDAVVLADGFSCRKQVTDLTELNAISLAELLRPKG